MIRPKLENKPQDEKTTQCSGFRPGPTHGKPGCTATEDGYRLEISDLASRGIILSVKRKERR